MPKIKSKSEDLFEKIFDLENGFYKEMQSKELPKRKEMHLKELPKKIYYELFDSNKLAFIINNLSEVKKLYRPEARDNLCVESFYNKSEISEDGLVGIKTTKYTNNKNGLMGRLQADPAISGQGMVREVRSTIFKDFYYDLDINNAHPVITKWICDKIKIPCKYINEYIENRESIFEELISLNPGYTRGKFKQVFLAIMYGGSEDFNEVPNKNDFIKNYKNEISSIHVALSEAFPKFKKIVEELAKKNNKEYNILGKTASHVCCFVENQLLQYMVEYLNKNMPKDKFKNCIMCFDGIMYRKGVLDNNKVIQDLEKIYSDLNIPIKLSIKEFHPLDLESMGYDSSIKYECKSIEPKKDETLVSILENVFDDNESNLANLVIKTDFLDHDVADYFINKYKNYIYYDNNLYFYNGSYWEQSIESYEIKNTLANEYFYINDRINKSINIHKENTNVANVLSKAIKNSKKLRTESNIKAITSAIKSKISINKDIFDTNPFLVCFLNGTYDLKENIFRENRLEDYISKCNDYDFKIINTNDENMILLNNFLKQVMPKEDELDFLLLVLSTTLYGNTLDKFIIATGAGGNGKDTLFTNLMPSVICDNYYKGNVNSITKKSNCGPNQELASCHKRNMILFNEPDTGEKVITSTVKDMSGGKAINARGVYCSNTNTKLTCSIFMLSNELPLLDKVDKAMERRLVVFNFNTLFSMQEDLTKYKIKEGKNDDGHYYYLANPYFQNMEFIEKVKLPMMNLLIQSFQKFQNNKYVLTEAPQSIKENNKKYLSSSDNFISWFNYDYKFVNDSTKTITLKDLYADYKCSYLYENLTKQDKRKNNYNWFSELIKNNIYLRHYYKEHNNTKTLRRHLFSYKKIERNKDDEDVDDVETSNSNESTSKSDDEIYDNINNLKFT